MKEILFGNRALQSLIISEAITALRRTMAFVPWEWMPRIAATLAPMFPALVPARHRLVLDNLRLAFNSSKSPAALSHLTSGIYRHIALWGCEFLKLGYMSRCELCQRVDLIGREHIHDGLERGKGVIIASAHVGNWELMGARIVAEGFPLAVIAREQRSSRVSKLQNAIRHHAGMEVLLRGPGRNGSLRGALRALRENKALGIMLDQHAVEAAAVPLQFFGHPASVHVSAALLAVRTGATLVVGFDQRREDGSHVVTIHPPIEPSRTGNLQEDLRNTTAIITAKTEEQIRRFPVQWFWTHNRWKITKRMHRPVRRGT